MYPGRDTQPSCANLSVPATKQPQPKEDARHPGSLGTTVPEGIAAPAAFHSQLPHTPSPARGLQGLRVPESWGSPLLALLPRARQGSSAEVGIPSKRINRASSHLPSPGKGLGDLGQRNPKSTFGDAQGHPGVLLCPRTG